MTPKAETLEQAMWHLFIHTAHEVCPDIKEGDLEIVLRSNPALFDMAAGTVMRTIRLEMLSAENHSPDSDHANEQRETDERRCFAGDCAKDGVAGVDSAEPGDRQLGIWAGMPVVAPADTPTGPAAAGEAKPVIQGRWPSDGLRKTEIP